jgi:hypothetical protein
MAIPHADMYGEPDPELEAPHGESRVYRITVGVRVVGDRIVAATPVIAWLQGQRWSKVRVRRELADAVIEEGTT